MNHAVWNAVGKFGGLWTLFPVIYTHSSEIVNLKTIQTPSFQRAWHGSIGLLSLHPRKIPGSHPSWSEMTLRIIIHKQEQGTSADGSTLALKPMSRLIWSLKQVSSGPTKWTSIQKRKRCVFAEPENSSFDWVHCARIVEYIRGPEPSHIICIV